MINESEYILYEVENVFTLQQKYKMSRFITADEYFMGKQCVLWEFWTYLFFLCANEGFWNYHIGIKSILQERKRKESSEFFRSVGRSIEIIYYCHIRICHR